MLQNINNQNKKNITLKTYEDKKFISIGIEDNGVGIEQSLIEKIFDPLFSTKINNESMGMGLFIVNTILETMNASIEVLSKPKEGAKFIIRLPK